MEIPKLLQNKKARQLNDKLIKVNHSFAFLGEDEYLINRRPVTEREAFELYVSRLYVLYHDYGMNFIQAYVDGASKVLKRKQYYYHIKFIYRARSALQHSNDDDNNRVLFKILKDFYFKDDSGFIYKDWNDFWLNAEEPQWSKVVRIIIKDCNDFYDDYLCRIADNDSYMTVLSAQLTENFKTGKYKNYYNNDIMLYDDSFNYRFMHILSGKAMNYFDCSDHVNVKRNLCKIRDDADVKSEISNKIMRMLSHGSPLDSQGLYLSIVQFFVNKVKESMEKAAISSAEEMLD